jgi:tripartite-type tricarboxylate transporter receptor subunit TctC
VTSYPISIIASFPLILTVNAAAPIHSVQDLIAYAKANPEKANAGASGPIFQVVQKMFELRTGRRVKPAHDGSRGTSGRPNTTYLVLQTRED